MSILREVDAKLKGAPEAVLTIGLILAGIVAWIVALFGTPTLKATVLTWMTLP